MFFEEGDKVKPIEELFGSLLELLLYKELLLYLAILDLLVID